jgi:hypothetical protein
MIKKKFRWKFEGRNQHGSISLPEMYVKISHRPVFPYMLVATDYGPIEVPISDKITLSFSNTLNEIDVSSGVLRNVDHYDNTIEAWEFFNTSMKKLDEENWLLSYKESKTKSVAKGLLSGNPFYIPPL